MIAYLLPDADPVHKVTIIPRGRAGGYTMMLPDEDRSYETRSYLLAQIRVALGGRAAEQLMFNEISSGASGDLQSVTHIVRQMITRLGMSSKLGPMVFGEQQEQVFLGKNLGHDRNYGEGVAELIDQEMHDIVAEAYAETLQLLRDNREALQHMADALIEVETINHDQVDNIVKYGTLHAPGQEPAPEAGSEPAVAAPEVAEVPAAPEPAVEPVEDEVKVEKVNISPWGNTLHEDKPKDSDEKDKNE